MLIIQPINGSTIILTSSKNLSRAKKTYKFKRFWAHLFKTTNFEPKLFFKKGVNLTENSRPQNIRQRKMAAGFET